METNWRSGWELGGNSRQPPVSGSGVHSNPNLRETPECTWKKKKFRPGENEIYSFPSRGDSFVSSPFLYLVEAEFWVHDEDVTRGPQTALFLTAPAEGAVVQVVGGLHGDQAEEAPVVGTTGAERQLLRRIGRQNLTSVAAETHAVVHDLGTEPKGALAPPPAGELSCLKFVYLHEDQRMYLLLGPEAPHAAPDGL